MEKLIYHYFPKLKEGGILIIDDINWPYYTSNGERDNFFREINNRETFYKLIEIYNSNKDNLSLEFNFAHSGVSKIKKKKKFLLNKAKKIKSREFTILNLIKKIINK